MKKEKTKEQNRKELRQPPTTKDAGILRDYLEIDAIMEEVMHDPEVAQAAEEAQRELGTLTPEELRRRFTI